MKILLIKLLYMKEVQDTLAFYAKNADSFAINTQNIAFSALQNQFINYLSPGTHILDFGCGAGRDAKAFREKGFHVEAIDGCIELCAIAKSFAGVPVRCMSFDAFCDPESYDGIWACASLLHLPLPSLHNVLARISDALHPQGILYISFKYGSFSGMRHGRYFCDMNEDRFGELLANFPQFSVLYMGITQDARPERSDEQWLNVFLLKTPSSL